MIIVDTGFWVALANKNDNYHEAAKKTFSQYDASLVLLAEEYQTGRILSLDVKDFSIYKWNNKNHFENLFIS
ncbi:hypothetical protein AY600_11525 [Phormidium willei BDU 130791]|nr:hypothetical protein AY600_11525 [Phormidium willei BDU 130791]